MLKTIEMTVGLTTITAFWRGKVNVLNGACKLQFALV
jgi:hypothetical protein